MKAVIFDMDGLMINSERVTYECYVSVLKEMGLTMSEDFYKTLLGKTLPTAYQLMNNIFDKDGVPIKKGLIELLTYLKEHQYKTIVATSSTRNRVEHLLGLADVMKYFDDSICGDEVTQGKPHPEVFLKACEKLGVEVQDALVLEDSEAGIEASYRAHIPVICIPDMKYPEEQYVKMTTKILDSLDQVIDYIKQ